MAMIGLIVSPRFSPTASRQKRALEPTPIVATLLPERGSTALGRGEGNCRQPKPFVSLS